MPSNLGINTDKSAFTVRQPRFKFPHLLALGAMIAISLYISVYYAAGSLRDLLILVISAIIVGFVYMLQGRDSEERTAAEFQCVVFSGAMRGNTLLTIILYRDGSIFYLDPRYAMNFPKASTNHDLDHLLGNIGLDNDQKIAVLDGIKDGKRAELGYNYNSSDKKPIALQLKLFPLTRPEGFIALTLIEK